MGRVCTSPDTGVSMAAAAAAKRTTGAEEWWQTLPEKDECDHSQNSTRRSITPPCQNLGPVKDDRRTLWVRQYAGASDVNNLSTQLDFTHFKRHKRGNLQYDGTEWRGVSVHRSWRSIVKNPPTPTTSGYAQR